EWFILIMQLADRRRLLAFGLREIGRRLYRRTSGLRLVLTPFPKSVLDRLLGAPSDLRAIDPFVAEEITRGRYALAGTMIDTDGQSPFVIEESSRAFTERLHSFAWLRHVRAERTDQACAHARWLVASWMTH